MFDASVFYFRKLYFMMNMLKVDVLEALWFLVSGCNSFCTVKACKLEKCT